MSIKTVFITLLFASIFFLFFTAHTTFAAACQPNEAGIFHCKAFTCFNAQTGKYEYDEHTCTVQTVGFPQSTCQALQTSSSRTYQSTALANTNWDDIDANLNCGTPPGCNQGTHGDNIPTCSGGGGGDGEGGGSCPTGCNANGDSCRATGSHLLPPVSVCPAQWIGDRCNDIPCAYRDECSCGSCLNGCSPSCEAGGCVGGGGEPTPTPTPAPSCSLSCPGTEITGGNDGGAGGGGGASGTAGGSSSTTYTAAGKAEGNITFTGINNFNCSVFTDENGYTGPCPSPTIVSGGGGGDSGILGTWTTRSQSSSKSSWSGFPFASYLSKLLKGTGITNSFSSVLGTSTLLAQANPGGGGASGGASGGTSGGSSTTWTFPEDFHILEQDQPKKYTATAIDSGGGASGGGQCACAVTLTCPETLQEPNEPGAIIEGCDNQCDFTVNPAQQHNNVETTFELEIPNGFDNITIDYDDGYGTTDSLEDATNDSSFEYTYRNAGVYDVAITCSTQPNGGGSSRSCTRRLTSYCTGTNLEDLPIGTPTPSPTPGPWMKVQDSSVHIRSSVTSSVPSGALAFDASDTATCSAGNPNSLACFNSGEAGGIVAESSSAEFGTEISKKGWIRRDENYAMNSLMTPSSFIEYVKARKDYKVVTALTADQLETNRIHLFDPETTALVSSDAIPDMIPAGSGMVIIVDGDMTIDMSALANQAFNQSKKAITFIVTGRLQISAATTELNGLFITNEVDFAYDYVGAASTPLKVVGNMSAMNSPLELCNEHRARIDSRLKPTCLFQFDYPNQFPPLIDMISTKTYDWTQLVPTSE